MAVCAGSVPQPATGAGLNQHFQQKAGSQMVHNELLGGQPWVSLCFLLPVVRRHRDGGAQHHYQVSARNLPAAPFLLFAPSHSGKRKPALSMEIPVSGEGRWGCGSRNSAVTSEEPAKRTRLLTQPGQGCGQADKCLLLVKQIKISLLRVEPSSFGPIMRQHQLFSSKLKHLKTSK